MKILVQATWLKRIRLFYQLITRYALKPWKHKSLPGMSLITVTFLLLPIYAFAGSTGVELKASYEVVYGFLTGWGGKLICIGAIIIALFNIAKSFSPHVLTSCIVTCLSVGYMPKAIDLFVTGVI